MPRKLIEAVSDKSLSLSNSRKEIDRLRREIKACEALIKQHQENEEKLIKTVKRQDIDLTNLKKKLQTNPDQRALQLVEDQFNKS